MEEIDEPYNTNEGERSIHQLNLQKHLGKLSIDQQEAIQLRFWLNYDYETIVKLTKVPIGTVKSRISYGLKKLKKYLGGEYL